MSTLKVNAIRGTGASSDAISVNSTDGTCTAKDTNIRTQNLIINGSFQIWQRSTSSTSAGYATADRWQTEDGNLGSPTITRSRQTLATSDGPYAEGHKYYFRKAFGSSGTVAANSDCNIKYKIESQDLANCGWDYKNSSGSITLSFWARASKGQVFHVWLWNHDAGYTYDFPFTLTDDTWTKITKTIPGNSNLSFNLDNGLGIEMRLTQFMGTNNTTSGHTQNQWATYSGTDWFPDFASTWLVSTTPTFDVTGVQLTPTDYRPNYPHRSYGDELLRCKRYYQTLSASPNYIYANTMVGNTDRVLGPMLPVELRTGPTVTSAATLIEFSSGTARSVSSYQAIQSYGGGYIQLGAAANNSLRWLVQYSSEI